MKNKIITIGFLGVKRCYLNISKEEAKEKYCTSEKITIQEFDNDIDIDIDVVEFDVEFGAYSINEAYDVI